jgi:hypothetical protein
MLKRDAMGSIWGLELNLDMFRMSVVDECRWWALRYLHIAPGETPLGGLSYSSAVSNFISIQIFVPAINS